LCDLLVQRFRRRELFAAAVSIPFIL
jgi:hypothetical protein